MVGGASNTRGAVLRKFFDDEQLVSLTSQMHISVPTNLDYYPLVHPGERFPINDPDMAPRLEPRPASDAVFLQGMSFLRESMLFFQAIFVIAEVSTQTYFTHRNI